MKSKFFLALICFAVFFMTVTNVITVSANDGKTGTTASAPKKEADAKEADAKEADAKEADAKEADAKEAEAKEADAKEADAKEADTKMPAAKTLTLKEENADLEPENDELDREKGELKQQLEDCRAVLDSEKKQHAATFTELTLKKNAALYAMIGLIVSGVGLVLLIVLFAYIYYVSIPQLKSFVTKKLADQEKLRQECDKLKEENRICKAQMQDVDRIRRQNEMERQKLNAVYEEAEALKTRCSQQETEIDTMKDNLSNFCRLFDNEIFDIWDGTVPDDDKSQFIMLALGKIGIMERSGKKINDILREFQYFDNQLFELIQDQSELQNVRKKILPFLESCMRKEYRIMWPELNTNIAQYNTEDELDLESANGTVIVSVKCAAIYDADDADENYPFQKAKVICE